MPDRPTQVVQTADELTDLCRHLRDAGGFAFDTEFVTEDTYTPVLCLVQVATEDRLAIVDPLTVSDLTGFWSLIADPAHRVTAHAAEAEIRFCQQFIGRTPEPLFDVQIAAGLAGYGYPLSYTNLVRRVLQKHVRGSETRTEWRRRPLTDKQIHYALEDVRYLLELRGRLEGELDRAGRTDWAKQEFRAQVRQRETKSDELWRRVSGINSLNRRQLAVLRELAAWRTEQAKSRDRPIRSIATDDILVELAKRQPTDENDLVMFRGMNRRNLRRVAGELMDAIRRGMATPEADCPSFPPRPDDGDQVRMLTGILATALTILCSREKLPSTMVASSADLAALVRGYISEGTIPEQSPLAQGWRRQLCGQLLLDLLAGRITLRVTDPEGEMPVALEELKE